MSKIIFGCGYLGRRVAKLWRDTGESVCVVTRSTERAAEFQNDGYQTFVADVTRPKTLVDLPTAETVLYAVGFDRQAGNTIDDVYTGGVKNVLAALPSDVQQFIYISTTGVYGPANGDWVDETTTPNPQRDGGKASLAAEQLLHSHPLGANAAILRLAGIYGPDRIPYLAKLRAGEPIAAPQEGWLNLIHVEDGAAAIIAAEACLFATTPSSTSPAKMQATGPHVFCVSDGTPVIRGEYYCEVARRIGANPPKFTAPAPTSPAAARATADKRICNAKLREQLNIKLTYPSYRQGLAAILKEA